jgi:uncharacterized membrane protein HdeD (DUF308 family)
MTSATASRTDAEAVKADTVSPVAGTSTSTMTRADPSAWMLMLRGAVAIAFGVLALLWPGLTLLALVGLFAAYALLGGIVSIANAFRIRRADPKWWLPLLLGVISVAAGIYAVLAPAVTALVLVLLMGVNAILTGGLDIAMAVRMRRAARGHWMLLLSGAVSVLFGVLVIAAPGAGALALVWLVSFYATLSGVLLFGVGWRMRRAAHHQSSRPAAAAAPR